MNAPALNAVERAPIDALLVRLLVREIDAATWAGLQDPDVIRFFEKDQEGFAAWMAQPATPELLDALAEEFAALFLVPGGVSLFASAWLGGDPERVAAERVELVQNALAALGREPLAIEPWGRLPMDHLGLWLDVIVAAAAAAPELAEALNEALLGPWVGDLGQALAEKATSPIYRALGRLLHSLHGHDA